MVLTAPPVSKKSKNRPLIIRKNGIFVPDKLRLGHLIKLMALGLHYLCPYKLKTI